MPNAEIYGIDISEYARLIANPNSEPQVGNATKLPWADNTFDLVLSITTLHNLYAYDLDMALREIERVGNHKYVRGKAIEMKKKKPTSCIGKSLAKPLTPQRSGDGGLGKQITQGYSFIYFE